LAGALVEIVLSRLFCRLTRAEAKRLDGVAAKLGLLCDRLWTIAGGGKEDPRLIIKLGWGDGGA
jgi:hypothetical protein